MAKSSRYDGLAWESYFQVVSLIYRGRTCPTAAKIAFVVGTILTLVNQGSAFLAGEVSWAMLAHVTVNYLVPFIVSSLAYLAPFRSTHRESTGDCGEALTTQRRAEPLQ